MSRYAVCKVDGSGIKPVIDLATQNEAVNYAKQAVLGKAAVVDLETGEDLLAEHHTMAELMQEKGYSSADASRMIFNQLLEEERIRKFTERYSA